MGGVSALGGVNRHVTAYIGQRETGCSVASYDTAGIGVGSVDGTCGVQILNRRAIGKGERSAVSSTAIERCRNGMTGTIE